jgi:hypothetical protein
MLNFELPNIIYKYMAIYKEEISNKLVELIFPIIIKSLKYYGVYQIFSNNYLLIANILVAFAILLIVIVATNTITTCSARAPLFILIKLNFLLEQFLYRYISALIIIIIRIVLFFVGVYIYISYHINYNRSQAIETSQPQNIYNVVINNNYSQVDNIQAKSQKLAVRAMNIQNDNNSPMTDAMKEVIERRKLNKTKAAQKKNELKKFK